jgi:hypothetical protein
MDYKGKDEPALKLAQETMLAERGRYGTERMHPSGYYESELNKQTQREHKTCKKPGRVPRATNRR